MGWVDRRHCDATHTRRWPGRWPVPDAGGGSEQGIAIPQFKQAIHECNSEYSVDDDCLHRWNEWPSRLGRGGYCRAVSPHARATPASRPFLSLKYGLDLWFCVHFRAAGTRFPESAPEPGLEIGSEIVRRGIGDSAWLYGGHHSTARGEPVNDEIHSLPKGAERPAEESVVEHRDLLPCPLWCHSDLQTEQRKSVDERGPWSPKGHISCRHSTHLQSGAVAAEPTGGVVSDPHPGLVREEERR